MKNNRNLTPFSLIMLLLASPVTIDKTSSKSNGKINSSDKKHELKNNERGFLDKLFSFLQIIIP